MRRPITGRASKADSSAPVFAKTLRTWCLSQTPGESQRARTTPGWQRSPTKRLAESVPTPGGPASDPDVGSIRPVQVQEAADRLRATDRPDANALGGEIPAASHGEGLHCDLVADTFDEHDCTRTLDPGSLPTRREP